jgi:hypothetical protein
MMSRGDVQAYIFEREHKAARTQRRLPRVSILVTVIGIVVSATVAGLIFVWTNRALLSPTAAGIRGGIGVDQPFSYFVSYGNIGKEPAYGSDLTVKENSMVGLPVCECVHIDRPQCLGMDRELPDPATG